MLKSLRYVRPSRKVGGPTGTFRDDANLRVAALVNDLISRRGDKWTISSLEVLTGKERLRSTRVGDLVEDISPKIITQTLPQMERGGFLIRTVHASTHPNERRSQPLATPA